LSAKPKILYLAKHLKPSRACRFTCILSCCDGC